MKEETVGLSELSSSELKCGSCGFRLVDIVLIETNEQRKSRSKPELKSQYTVVDCPKCHNSSFSSDVLEGTVVIGSVKSGFHVEVEDTDVEDDVVKVVLKVINDKQ